MVMTLALPISVTLVCAPASGPTASGRPQTYTSARSVHDRALTVAVRKAGIDGRTTALIRSPVPAQVVPP